MSLSAFSAIDIDSSVDYEIRKKYNPNKIEEDLLPPLPDKLKNDVPVKSNEDFTKTYSKPQNNNSLQNNLTPAKNSVKPSRKRQQITLKKGTKLTLRTTSIISDRMSNGTKVYFKLPKPINTRHFSLPSNTKFVGVIVDAHSPQITGNGGLIVIRIEKVIINGVSQEMNAKVTKSNYKKVFFNNIKGKRKYLANLLNAVNPGKNFNDRMWKTTKRLANDNITIIFSPFTLVTGLVVYGANVVTSPVIAFFSKGASISIPADTAFEIKLLEDTTFYN